MSINPKNKSPGIGKEGQRIACELAKEKKNILDSNINNLNSEIKRLEQESEEAKEIHELAERKPNIDNYEKDLESIKKEIDELNKRQENIFLNNNDFEKIGKLNQKIEQRKQLITDKNLPSAELRVINCEKH